MTGPAERGTGFRTETHGKWILAGEHAVLRGSPALVFPLKSKRLLLEFAPAAQALRLELAGDHGRELEPLFWAVLERACDLMKIPRATLTGSLRIDSNIPIGAGLGASAAFCVAVTRWFHHQKWIKGEDRYEFARTLENLFHGESSGVDIAVALSGEGMHFERDGRRFSVVPKWSPRWSISYTGQRATTADAVGKVKTLLANDPERGRRLDRQMRDAVADCERALALPEAEGFPLLVSALDSACDCFREWGLADGAVADHLGELRTAGAVAVKPTGSGGGGYVLSLWAKAPPESLSAKLIAASAV